LLAEQSALQADYRTTRGPVPKKLLGNQECRKIKFLASWLPNKKILWGGSAERTTKVAIISIGSS
jgi:hypothetical protein